MRSLVLMLLLLFFLQGCKTSSVQKAVTINENIEWTHSWVVSANKTDLPGVLVIGDSHAEAYYPLVAKGLAGKAYCCKFTTSRSMGDPLLIEQLELMFHQFKFDIVSFNNGLHGKEYTAEQYGDFIPAIYRLFEKYNIAKCQWVNTTAWRNSSAIDPFHPFTDNIKRRNEMVRQFALQKNIPLIDLYSISINHPEYYSGDGVHFNNDGIAAEAKVITAGILKFIDNEFSQIN